MNTFESILDIEDRMKSVQGKISRIKMKVNKGRSTESDEIELVSLQTQKAILLQIYANKITEHNER
jgi:hypothetical protein